jgi:hypothetical protein
MDGGRQRRRDYHNTSTLEKRRAKNTTWVCLGAASCERCHCLVDLYSCFIYFFNMEISESVCLSRNVHEGNCVHEGK